MTEYSKVKAINDLLNRAEDSLTDVIGRCEAQRFVALFLNADMKGFNLYQELYDAGKKEGKA